MKLAFNDYIRDSINFYNDACYPFRMLCSKYFKIRMKMMVEFNPGQQVNLILVWKSQLRLAQVGSLSDRAHNHQG